MDRAGASNRERPRWDESGERRQHRVQNGAAYIVAESVGTKIGRGKGGGGLANDRVNTTSTYLLLA